MSLGTPGYFSRRCCAWPPQSSRNAVRGMWVDLIPCPSGKSPSYSSFLILFSRSVIPVWAFLYVFFPNFPCCILSIRLPLLLDFQTFPVKVSLTVCRLSTLSISFTNPNPTPPSLFLPSAMTSSITPEDAIEGTTSKRDTNYERVTCRWRGAEAAAPAGGSSVAEHLISLQI